MFKGGLFSKFIVASGSLVIAACLTLTTVFVLNDSNVIDLKDDKPHYYDVNFYVEDVLVYSEKYLKGDYIAYAFENIPAKDQDADGTMYVFSGWDLFNNGLVDVFPAYAYANINAHALFTPFKVPDIDLSKIDLYQLLQLLEDLDIDLESFINFFGLDLEDLLELLKVDVFSYNSDYRGIAYFRNESFGSYNSKKSKRNDANYFSYEGFADRQNPLTFTSNILKQNQNPSTFNISYNKGGSKFPVASYELNVPEDLNTDAYSLTSPVDKKYTSVGYAYLPATNYTIQLLKNYKYTDENLKSDELAYRDYVYDNYLEIDDKYAEFFTELSKKQGISYNNDEDYTCIDYMGTYFMHNTVFNYVMESYPKTQDPIIYFLTDAKEGTARHYASATTLWFRSLGIPARYCQGYISYSDGASTTVVNALQSHSWTEIYIDGIGWMQVDLSLNCLSKEMLMYMFYGTNLSDLEFDDYGKKKLLKIEAIPDEKEQTFFIGDVFTYNLLKVYAYYDDETSREVVPTKVFKPKMDTKGTKTVTVIYNEGDYTEYATYKIEVVEPEIVKISLDTNNVKKVFYKGDNFEYDGLKIKIHYANGRISDYFGDYTVELDDENAMLNVGVYLVTVSVVIEEKSYSDTYEIEVFDSGVKEIRITSTRGKSIDGKKDVFAINEDFDPSFLIIDLIYSTGNSISTSFDPETMVIVGFDSKKSGKENKEYYVNYTNEEGLLLTSNKISYLVDQVTKIEVISNRISNEYMLKEEFNYAEIDIRLEYLSGNYIYTYFDENTMTLNNFNTNKSGNYKYSISYINSEGKKLTSNEIEYVVPGLDKIEISSPTKEYYLNDEFDYSSLSIKFIYTNKNEFNMNFDRETMEIVNFDSSSPVESAECYLKYIDEDGNEYHSNVLKYKIKDLPTIVYNSPGKIDFTYTYGSFNYDKVISDIKNKITGVLDGDQLSLDISEEYSDYRIAGRHNLTIIPTIYRNGIDITTTKYRDINQFTVTIKVNKLATTISTKYLDYDEIYTNDLSYFYVKDEDGKEVGLGLLSFPRDFISVTYADGDSFNYDFVEIKKGTNKLQFKNYQFIYTTDLGMAMDVTSSYRIKTDYGTLIYE